MGLYETYTHVTPTMENVEQNEFFEVCKYENDAMPDLGDVRKTAKKGVISKKEVPEILRLSGIHTPSTLHEGLMEVQAEIQSELKRLKSLNRKIASIIKSVVRTEWENAYISPLSEVFETGRR